MDGFKGIKETFPAILVAALSFTTTQFLSSNHLGAELPDIISAVVSLAVTTVFLKFWKPKIFLDLTMKAISLKITP